MWESCADPLRTVVMLPTEDSRPMGRISTSTNEKEMLYEEYNREERHLCSHLFRLLHEPREEHLALRTFLGGDPGIPGFQILAEVALIRDAYRERRAAPDEFMNRLTQKLMDQEGVEDCRLYSELPEQLRSCPYHSLHPAG